MATSNGLENEMKGIKVNRRNPNKNVVFIGNPGVGKSTLLNCLIGQAVFKGGVNIITGLTKQLKTKKFNGVTYCDTPGLEDVEMREQASTSIAEALKQGGKFFVAFVITLEAGRVKPEDVSTIEAVLKGTPEITKFGLIINKLTSTIQDELAEDKSKLHVDIIDNQILWNMTGRRHPAVHLVPRYTHLEDNTNSYMELPLLNQFVENSLKLHCFTIYRERVNVTLTLKQYNTTFKREMDKMEELRKLKLEQAAMKKMRRDDIEEREKKLRELKKQNDKQQQEIAHRRKEQEEKHRKDTRELEMEFTDDLLDIQETQNLEKALQQSLLECSLPTTQNPDDLVLESQEQFDLENALQQSFFESLLPTNQNPEDVLHIQEKQNLEKALQQRLLECSLPTIQNRDDLVLESQEQYDLENALQQSFFESMLPKFQ